MCALLLSWSGGQFERELPPDLSTLSVVRRDLRRWLGARGLDDDTADDLVLATSEALANAAEHGSAPDEHVAVQAWFEQSAGAAAEVVVHVQDQGTWAASPTSPERGRGMSIMSALVDDVAVETGNGTSVSLRRRTGRRSS